MPRPETPGAETATVPTFIERFGVIRWTKDIGRRYPRDGVCEICGLTGAEVADEDAAIWAEFDVDLNPLRYALLSKLQFDHCHLHLIVRGLLCLPCNNAMGCYERGFGVGGRFADRQATHVRKCPECRVLAEPGSGLRRC